MIDLLITNGNILTLDNDNNTAGSVAVSNGEISQIWTEAFPPRDDVSLSENTKVIDLQGKTMIPGFIDTHNHILRYSIFKDQVDCGPAKNKSIQDILDAVKQAADAVDDDVWIEGYGYDDTLLQENRHPTRFELDQVSPNNPVYINHISGHIAVVNSKALEKANIDHTVADLQGGYYGRDDNDQLNGVLYELPVMNTVKNIIPLPTKEDMIEQLGKGAKDYLAQGITTNTDAATGMDWGDTELDAHLEAGARGVNPLRSQLMMIHTELEKNGRFEDYTAESLNKELQQQSNGTVQLSGAKLFQDGSIQGLTGALREPYYKDTDKNGELYHDQDVFNQRILDLHNRGFRVAVHGNGDQAIESIIDAYEYAVTQSPKADHRHRIEHVQTASLNDLKRMKQLDIAASFFINHVYYWGDRHKRIFLGPKRAERIDPLADAVDQDLLFTLHSDCPITPISPLFSIWAAVNRVTLEGDVLGEAQKIDVMTALKSMTIYGAALNFQEDELGSIEVGKKADFAILDNNPLTVSPMKIKDINVLTTLINGEIVYERNPS
jgi:predicted amidohydrolase YtcJ